jgi:CubicO group peptidase (beta-lactamase class C family)
MIPTFFIATAAAVNLAGVWRNVETFGPTAPARVTLVESAAGWRATAGNRLAVSSGALPLVFHFGTSSLHVRRDGGRLAGQWYQPPTIEGASYASPVRLDPKAAGRWTGALHPLADRASFFLALRPAADGSWSALLRNPEFNHGGEARLVLDGDSVSLHYGRRGVAHGWIDASATHLSLYFSDLVDGYGGPFVFTRVRAEEAPGFVARTGTAPYVYRKPADLGDGWPTASLQSVGLDPRPLAALVNGILRERPASRHSPAIQGISIARHGKLVFDEYFFGFDANRPHDVRSAGKSVTTLMLGRAIQDGAPISARSRISPLFPQYAPFANPDPRKERITVADLATMSSGYACDDDDDDSPGNEDTMQSQTKQPDWYKYTLDLPMASDPGNAAIYCTASINLLGGIISRVTNRPLVDYFYEKFARPMQFRYYAMLLTPAPLTTAYMGGGDYMLPRDFLKFGQLFLNHGTWNGHDVIDQAWLREVSTNRAHVRGEIGDYGYGWHLYTYHVRGRTIHAINAGGNGGQLLFVFPELDMTVMLTGGQYGDYLYGWKTVIDRVIPDQILPAALH